MALTDELMDMVGNTGGLAALGGLLDGNDDAAQGAMTLAVPALIGGLGKRASTPIGASAVFDLVNSSDGRMLDSPGGLFGGNNGGMGSLLISAILGGRKDTVETSLAEATGVNPGAISKFLPALAPIVVSFLKIKVKGGGLNSGRLAMALVNERTQNTNPEADRIFEVLDGGDDVADHLGFLEGIKKMGALGGVGTAADIAANRWDTAEADLQDARAALPDRSGSPMDWLLPLFGFAAAVVLIGLLWASRDTSDTADSMESHAVLAEQVHQPTNGGPNDIYR